MRKFVRADTASARSVSLGVLAVDGFPIGRLAYPPEYSSRVAYRPHVKDTVRRNSNTFTLVFVAVTGIATAACQSGGVGDPCVPEDEYNRQFPGYQPNESNVESQSFQCETRVCLVAN